MRVKILFFGQLKDIVELSQEELHLPDGAHVSEVWEHYAGRFPKLREMGRSIVLAHNREFAAPPSPIADGDEVAFLPPVSGGAGPYVAEIADAEGHFFALTREAIDTETIRARMLQPQDGAMVVFDGVVRNNSQGRATRFLDYEAYEPMALQTMARIGREIASKYEVGRIAMVHRLGRLQIGETSVLVAVAAPHRRPAFDAALEGINQLKKLVPIWKREHFEDGEVWVEGEWDSSVLQRS